MGSILLCPGNLHSMPSSLESFGAHNSNSRTFGCILVTATDVASTAFAFLLSPCPPLIRSSFLDLTPPCHPFVSPFRSPLGHTHHLTPPLLHPSLHSSTSPLHLTLPLAPRPHPS